MNPTFLSQSSCCWQVGTLKDILLSVSPHDLAEMQNKLRQVELDSAIQVKV